MGRDDPGHGMASGVGSWFWDGNITLFPFGHGRAGVDHFRITKVL